MNWPDVAAIVAPIAPTLGRLLGSGLPIPFGGAIGEAVGNVIAGALGVDPNPDAVGAAIQGTPSDVVKEQLATAEAEAKAHFEAIAEQAKAEGTIGTAQTVAIATTIKAELVDGAWYQRAWRPLSMFVWVSTWPLQIGTILYPVWFHDQAAIAALPSLIYALSAWNAGPAALAGVYSWNRTQEKVAATSSL
jgi:hypothetical protein